MGICQRLKVGGCLFVVIITQNIENGFFLHYDGFMKKRRLFLLLLILTLLVAVVAIFFSFRLVVFVYPSSLDDYYSRFYHPQLLNKGYFCIERKDDKKSFLEKIKNVDLYIYAPLCMIDEDSITPYFSLKDKNGRVIEVEKEDQNMWKTILSSFPNRTFVALYEESNEEANSIVESLSYDYPNLEHLTYLDRVSVVNKDEIVNTLNSYYGVLALTPESSKDALRSTKAKVVLDEIYGASLVSLDSLISLHYDWEKIINEYLNGGDLSFYYTFSVLH